MKSFLIKISLFALCFFILEKVTYLFIYASPYLEKDKRLEKVITGQMNKEIIILGSSRGARDIAANQIEAKTGLPTYNLSYPGSNVEFHEFLLRALIEFNEPPKIVLLVVDDSAELLSSESLIFRLDRLYPLAKYDYINQEMINRGEKTQLSWIFALARMNQRNLDLREKSFGMLDSISVNGSMPISFQREKISFDYETGSNNYLIQEELDAKRQAFQKINELCSKNGIKLIVVFPPNFRDLNTSFVNRLKEISSPKTDFFIYDTTNTAYQDKRYYYDTAHLKKNGAKLFTAEVNNYLNRSYLQAMLH